MSLLLSVPDKDVSPLPQDKLCLPHHILEERGLVKVGVTVQALLDLPPLKPTQLSAVWHEPESCVRPAVIWPTPLPSPNPHPIPRDQRAPRARTPRPMGPWESASAWLKQETGGRYTSVSLYDVSRHPLPVHHIFSCILFLAAGGHLVCVWTSNVTVCFLCELHTLDLPRRDRQDNGSVRGPLPSRHARWLLSLRVPALTTFPCWCWRHRQWGDDWHGTHSSTEET